MVVIGVVVFGGGTAVILLAGRLPRSTDAASLIVRAFVGLAIGSVIVFFVRRMLGALADPPPPAPERIDATRSDVVYECSVCGTRVRLELAATVKAPRHCGEEMEAKLVSRP